MFILKELEELSKKELRKMEELSKKGGRVK